MTKRGSIALFLSKNDEKKKYNPICFLITNTTAIFKQCAGAASRLVRRRGARERSPDGAGSRRRAAGASSEARRPALPPSNPDFPRRYTNRRRKAGHLH